MTTATKPQIDRILDLATRIEGKTAHSLYDIRHLLSGSHRNLSRADASTTIDDLKAQLAAKESANDAPAPLPTQAPEGGMDAGTAVSLLGKTVTLVSVSGRTIERAEVRTIELNENSAPAFTLRTSRGTYTTWALARIASWTAC
jgi:hypothetical protein